MREDACTLPVSNLAAAIEFYVTKLGSIGIFVGEPPFFAGITLGEVEIFLKEVTPAPNGRRVVSWWGMPMRCMSFLGQMAGGGGGDRRPGVWHSRLCGDGLVWVSAGVFGHHIYTLGPKLRLNGSCAGAVRSGWRVVAGSGGA